MITKDIDISCYNPSVTHYVTFKLVLYNIMFPSLEIISNEIYIIACLNYRKVFFYTVELGNLIPTARLQLVIFRN